MATVTGSKRNNPITGELVNYATHTDVTEQIENIIDSAPSAMDTLNELAAALGDDPNFATTVTNNIAAKWTEDSAKLLNWDNAYSWGDHASAGYGVLTSNQAWVGNNSFTGYLSFGNSSSRLNGSDALPLVQVSGDRAYLGSTGRTSTTIASSDLLTHTRGSSEHTIHTDYSFGKTEIDALGIAATTASSATTATKLTSISTSFSGEYPMVVNVNGVLYSHQGAKFKGSDGSLTATSFVEGSTTLSDKYQAKGSYVENSDSRMSNARSATLTGNLLTAVPVNAVFTDTTYSVEDGGLTQKNFTTTLKSKLDNVADNANKYVLPNNISLSGNIGASTVAAGLFREDGTSLVDKYQAKGNYVDNSDTRLSNARTPTLTGNLLTAVPANALFDNTWRSITNLVNSTSQSTSASALAVKTAYDLANTALPKSGGTMTGSLALSQNPVGTTYGQGVASVPTDMISQKVGDNDGWRMYGEAPASNDVKVIFEVTDDLETGDTWVFRNKKTYSPYTATEPFKISGTGDVTALGTISATSFSGNLIGNASTASFADSATNATIAQTATNAYTAGSATSANWSGYSNAVATHGTVAANAQDTPEGRLEYTRFSAGAAADGMPVSDNANGVITVGQHSGGYTAQLGFSSNSNIYWRDNPSTTTGAWKKVHDSDNFGKTEIDALNIDADTLDGREANEFIKVYDGQLINTDLDTLNASDTGVYHSNSQYGTNTNIPHNNYFTLLNLRNPYGGSVDSTGNSNDRAAQIFYGDTRGQAYWRPYQGSTTGWHPWEKIYTSYSLTKGVIDALNVDADKLDGQQGSYYAPASHVHSYLPLAGGTLTGALSLSNNNLTSVGKINAGAITNDNGGALRILSPDGASYTSNGDTGAIKIRLPQLWTNTMMTMTIKIYDYTTGESFELSAGGYNHTGGSGSWYNTFAHIISDPDTNRNFTVRFGHDGTKTCIWIGETTSGWSYPKVSVTDFQAGHSSSTESAWATGWVISIDSTLGTVQHTHSNNEVGIDGYEKRIGGTTVIDSNRNITNINNVSVNGALDVSSSSGISSTGWVHLQRYATNLNVAIGNNGSNVDLLVPQGDVLVTSTNPYPLVISKSVSGGGVGIKFTDQTGKTQHGFIDYHHYDTESYGSGNAFVYRGDQPAMSHVFDVGTNNDGMQVKVNGSAKDVHHEGNFGKTQIDALNVHAASATTATHATQATQAYNADNAANSANSLKLGNVAASGYMLTQTQGVYTAIQSGDWKVPALGQGTFAKSGSVGKPSGAGHGYWFNLGRRDGSAGGYAGIWVNSYQTAGSGAWLGRNDAGGDPSWEKIFTDKTLAKTDIDALNVHAASATTATNTAKLGNVAASDYQLKDDTAQFSYVAAPTDNWEEAAELKTLSDGTWIMEIFTNTSALGFYSCRWSATVAISSANSTNDDWNSEIPLHMSGHANSSNRGVYARTTMNLGATGKHLTLDIKVTNSSSTTATYIIKFRKLI